MSSPRPWNEHGILTREDLDGIELIWGNGEAMAALLEKLGGLERVMADFYGEA